MLILFWDKLYIKDKALNASQLLDARKAYSDNTNIVNSVTLPNFGGLFFELKI